jgi:hypothetical protein
MPRAREARGQEFRNRDSERSAVGGGDGTGTGTEVGMTTIDAPQPRPLRREHQQRRGQGRLAWAKRRGNIGVSGSRDVL